MFEIIVDSAANIPAELCRKFKIKVISFVNLVNGKEVTCYDPDLTLEEERQKGKEYYDAIKAGAEVKTGLISSGIFESVFKEIINQDRDVLYFSLSKNISGNYNSARIAADDVMESCKNDRKIRLIDSLNASLGQGLLAIYASEMREKGMEFDEVADLLETYPARMNGIFTVGNLKYLARSGRLSGTTALIGNALSIKPILRGSKDGYIVQFKKCRGRKPVLNELISLLCDNIIDPEEQIIGIAHADAYEDSLYVTEEIKKRIKVRDIINTSYDFCTGSHVGPDTIALFFMGKDRELGV
ncbi:MAG: DegV family protein [Lachnospiraceae bacterium]|nr:DegV family protein [Lachnospiraceae bacterium]